MRRGARAVLLLLLLPSSAILLAASIWIVYTGTERRLAEIYGEMERLEGRMDGLVAVRLRPPDVLSCLPADAAPETVLSEVSVPAPVSPAADPGRSREVPADAAAEAAAEAAADPGVEPGAVDAVAAVSETPEAWETLESAESGELLPAGKPEIVEKKGRAACRKLLRQAPEFGSDILPPPNWLAFLGRENPDDGSGRLILLDRRSGRIRRLLSGWEEGGWKLGLSEDRRNIVWVGENCYYLPEP